MARAIVYHGDAVKTNKLNKREERERREKFSMNLSCHTGKTKAQCTSPSKLGSGFLQTETLPVEGLFQFPSRIESGRRGQNRREARPTD